MVLVLIFMVVTPLLQVGYRVEVPPVVDTAAPPPGTAIGRGLAANGGNPLFVTADGEVPYGDALVFFDLCRSAGSGRLAVVLRDLGGDPAAAASSSGGSAR